MALPSDKKARLKLVGYISECVEMLKNIQEFKDEKDNVADIAKEELGITKTEFNKLVKAAFDREKVENQAEGLENLLADLSILENMGQEEDSEEEKSEEQEA